MGLLDNILQLAGYVKAKTPTGAELFAPQRNSAMGGAIPTYPLTFTGWPDRVGTQQLTAYQASITSWVYSDVQVLSREFQAGKIAVKELSGETSKDVVNHAFEQLWAKPNLYMGQSYLMSFWMHSILLKGKAFLFFAPDSANNIAEVWPIPPHQVTVVPDTKTFIGGYNYKPHPNADPIFIPPEYICYSRLVNPQNLRDGIAPLDAAMNAVQTDVAQSNWARNFFERKKAIPDALVTMPREVNPLDFNTIKTEILEGLFGNGVGVGFARAGDLDIKAFGFDMQKVQMIESRIASRNEIDRVFGIPEGYWSADASRANSDHAGDAVLGNVVYPYLVMLAQDLSSQIMPIFYDDNLRVEFGDIRPRNVDLQLREFDRLSTILTVDELRDRNGSKPLGDKRGAMLPKEITPAQGFPMLPTADASAANDKPAEAAPIATGDSVQSTALNGAQIASLLEVVQAVQASQLAPIAAGIVIRQSFPTIDQAEIDRMIAAAAAFKPAQTSATVEPAPSVAPPTAKSAPVMVKIADGASVTVAGHDDPASSASVSLEQANAFSAGYTLTSEARADLDRYQTKALKALKAGKLSTCGFTSAVIPPEIVAEIAANIVTAKDAQHIKRIFAGAVFLKRDDPPKLTPQEQALYDDLLPVFAEHGGDAASAILSGSEFDYDSLSDDLKEAIQPVLRKHVLQRMGELVTEYGYDSGDKLITAAGQWASTYTFGLVKGVTDTTRELLQNAVSDYQNSSGMTRGDLEARLQSAFGASRVESIAITETTRSSGAATDLYEAQLNDAGFDTVQVWNTANDDLVCDICGPINGKSDNEWGDVEGVPAHPRCRCSTTIKVIKKA